MHNKRRTLVSVVAALLALIMLLSLVVSVLPTRASAKSSSEIKQELSALESKAAKIKQEKAALAKEQAANASETKDTVQKKRDIDQQMRVLHEEIDNTNAQIQSYNLLISEKQKELDEAETRQAELNEKYQLRLRTMEESGTVQYWSVIFKARSFADLLDRMDMISEIAAADKAMLAQLDAVAAEIVQTQADLAEEKTALQEQKDLLAIAQAELDEKWEEANQILLELEADAKALNDLAKKYDAEAAAISDEIAAAEKAYNEAKKAEAESNNGGGGGSSGGGSSSSGWARPVSSLIVTCPFGYRTHPVTGQKNNFHNGVDLGMPKGSPIFATRSGTVTQVRYSNSWGNQVVINHGDGFSSMYAHMTHYIVTNGQQVSKGQVIGYVGSTGWSTGPHLHFTIYLNGTAVNPMNYIR